MQFSLKRSFASDNNAGIHPQVLKAIQEANTGHARGYGSDPYTEAALQKFRDIFGPGTETFFVFNGTGANVVALQALTRSFNAIICTEAAHINEDECGAPEKFTGCKLIDIHCADARLDVQAIQTRLKERGDEHQVQQRVISLTQSTEFGTVYTRDRLAAICEFAHGHGMYVHVDGARISNAAASLGIGFKEMLRDTGVDVLSFGGTKNGLMLGEAVVFLNPELASEAKFIRKQSMQLASKMRYLSAQFLAFFEEDLWLRNASHANAMARRLADKLSGVPQLEIVHPVEANGVFCKIPREMTEILQKEYFFYIFDEKDNVARFMCSWDTQESDVDTFAAFVRQTLS